MRYSHRYHQTPQAGVHHIRQRTTSFAILASVIFVLLLPARVSLDSHLLIVGFGLSLWRVCLSYTVSAIMAVFLALIATSSQRIENVLLPALELAQSFPTFAILPILVFYFGATTISVVCILVIAMIWPITFSLISGIKEQHRDQVEAAQVFGARGWKFLAAYRLPMLRPSLLTGSIVSWGQAWDTIVGAEIIAGVTGAGHYLGALGAAGDTRKLILGIAIYLFLIFSINQLVWLPLLRRYTRYSGT